MNTKERKRKSGLMHFLRSSMISLRRVISDETLLEDLQEKWKVCVETCHGHTCRGISNCCSKFGGRRMNLTDELILEIIKKLSWISDLNREEEE